MKIPTQIIVFLFFGLQLLMPSCTFAQQARITVFCQHTLHTLSPYMTGACIEDVNHEIYGGLYSQMVYGESFQEPPTPTKVSGFHRYGGDWFLEGNELHVGAGDGPKLVLDNTRLADGSAAVDIRFPERQGGPAGLIVKVSDPGTGADRFTGYEIGLNPGNNTLLLGRHRQNWEPITTVPRQVPIDKWIHLTVVMRGDTLDISVDGALMLSYQDKEHPLAAGSIGLRPWQRPVHYRNLEVVNDAHKRIVPFVADGKYEPISGMWHPVRHQESKDFACGFDLNKSKPFVGTQSQQIVFLRGKGEVGVENRGLNRWGMSFVRARPYEGLLWVYSERPLRTVVALQNADGTLSYAETLLRTHGHGWERLDFKLTPNTTDASGRMAILLREPGTLSLGYAFLQPGSWGRFHNLPVRRDIVEGLKGAGLTVLRYGGSMVNAPAYRWKQMVGPRDRRQPYPGTWYPFSSNGWGIPDFLNLCDAAGFLGVPDFNMDETPQDMADFVEYANGPTNSRWGRQRALDGHPEPYHLKYIELGNEEAVDERYWQRFEPMIQAIWAKDPSIVPVVGDFAYEQKILDPFHFTGSPTIQTLAAHKKILDLARKLDKEVWFDVHVWNQEEYEPRHIDGVQSLSDQLARLCPGSHFQLVVFELNANKHGIQRALATGRAINQLERLGDRVRIVCSANGLQPDGQNENGWDQGLLFLNPSTVWAQPPLYALSMLSNSRPQNCLRTESSDPTGSLDITATGDINGKVVKLQITNSKDKPVMAHIELKGWRPLNSVALVTSLSGPLTAVNDSRTNPIAPTKTDWKHSLNNPSTNGADYTFPAHSFSVVEIK